MTGAELLALLQDERPHTDQYSWALLPLDALNGCVLLTPAEQEKVRQFMLRGHKDECVPLVCDCGWREALELLSVRAVTSP